MSNLNTSIMWVLASLNFLVYCQTFALAGWILCHHTLRISFRMRFEMAATMAFSLACIVSQIWQASLGMVECQGIILKVMLGFVVFGSGMAVRAGLIRRDSYLRFRAQEDALEMHEEVSCDSNQG